MTSVMRFAILIVSSLSCYVASLVSNAQTTALLQIQDLFGFNLGWTLSPSNCTVNLTNEAGIKIHLQVQENSNFSASCCFQRVQCCLGLPCSSFINQAYGSCKCEAGSAVALDLSSLGIKTDFSTLLSALMPLIGSLSFLDLSDNQISGSTPDSITLLMNLTFVSLAHNQLTGGISDKWSIPPQLTYLDLSSNQLTGAVPRSLCKAGLSQVSPLVNLDLSRNQLTGVFNVPFCVSLQSLDLSFNNILSLGEGETNTSFLGYASLKSLVISGNPIRSALPFLNLDNLESFSASSCGLIGSLPPSLFAFASLTFLDLSNNSLTGPLPATIAGSSLALIDLRGNNLSSFWPLPTYLELSDDPSSLTGGLRCPRLLLNKTNAYSLTTIAIDPSFFLYQGCKCDPGFSLNARGLCLSTSSWISSNQVWVIAVSCAVGLVIILLTWFGCLRLVKTILAGAEKMKKRSMPEPKLGSVISFVVTDIEGYSSLMRRRPALMRDALMTHNSIIRAAKWKNYGSTLDQEGDSFILAFHDAFDAVSFALAAQMSLSEAQWPEGLLDRPRSPPPRSVSPGPSYLLTNLRAGRDTIVRSLKSVTGGNSFHNSTASGSPLASEVRRQAIQLPIISRLTSPSPMNSPQRAPASASDVSVDFYPAPIPAALDGLRVRMGIATGQVGVESSLRSNTVLSLAKEIGDVAAGGQILIDLRTFECVKERAAELGAIHELGKGLPQSISSSLFKSLFYSSHGLDRDVLLMHMGKFSSIEGDEQIELFQALPPSLASRAAVFGEIKVPSSSRWKKVLARGIVNAPGIFTTPGPFFSQAASSDPVSIVFCSIVNQKEISHSHPKAAATAHTLVTRAMEADLITNGGCMCRDLPHCYLLAFSSPWLALTFSLRIQDSLKTIPWPSDEGFPLLNAGITHSIPDCILISHDGRADYHGHGVNTAARILDVASRGGMIVCESWLALEAFEEMKRANLSMTSAINAWHIGGYSFKGCEEVKDLVAITTRCSPPHRPHQPGQGKGRKVQDKEGLFESYNSCAHACCSND